jgi:hypothetical protein
MVFRPVLESSGLSLSLYSPAPPGGEVNDARVGSQRDCFVISLLGGNTFSCVVIKWTVYPTTCTSLRLTAARRGARAYLQNVIQSCHGDRRWCLLGVGKLPGVSLPDGGFVLFNTYLWNITHSKWFSTRRCLPLAAS